ncbi:MAG TPA: DUF1942 domain-containing protein [Mycobacterium sp.]|jgi:hypothetical protein
MRNVITLTAAAASAAVIGLVGAVPASAEANTASFGTAQRITDHDVIASYTVSAPQPTSDVVNVPIAGKLYASKVTVQATQGAVTPAIPFFNARTSSGENYRVLFQAYAPEGLSGATIPQGDSATGNIYFDVTGAAPTIVAYNDAVQDRAVWQGGSSSARSETAPETAPEMATPDTSSSGASNSGSANANANPSPSADQGARSATG